MNNSAIQSSMQADSIEEVHRKYKNVLDCFRQIYKTQGLRAFWKGYFIPPFSVILFYLFFPLL